ncbi:ATP-binding protein [Brevundimonas sp. Root1279]|uniref:ATP-binding protein n=1 Tax=Brevundimonas sp. Root1279 TaxID=1736443 RepID=UPI0007023324|nr:ATP-binding protein [Brevundimonas sp. Root1279]KQW86558.1 histidine kinase [Brevundimonas sp. Root1279]
MFLEGQINWVWVLGGLAAVGWVVGLIGLWLAAANRSRHVDASDQLDMVQRVAEDSQKRLFETLNAIPVALVETDKQGKFVFANRAAHQLLGRRDAELIGLRFHSATWGITFPDGRPVPPDLLPSARALRGQTVRGFQHLIANPAARRKMLVSVTAMPIENELGQITGSTAAIVETEALMTPEFPVSEAVATVEPLIVPTAVEVPADFGLTRRVFDAASSALIVVDVHGVVREANSTALLVLGRDRAEGDFADLFLDEDERVEGRQALRAGLAAPAGEADPIVSRRGAEEGIRWSMVPLCDAEGRVDALLLAGERASPGDNEPAEPAQALEPIVIATAGADEALVAEAEAARAEAAAALAAVAAARAEAEAAREVAARIQAETEAELQGGRRMESVGRLTGGLAHDFNALLGVMTGALDMMLRQADDPGRVRRLGQAALAAGQRGEMLTRRLTAFAHGDDEPVLRVLDAGVLLRGLEARLRGFAGPGVDLMIEGPAEVAPVRLDPVAFEGAIKALTLNAVQAVGGQGSIAVRLESLMEGGVRLSVRDSGPGMDRDLAARALEPFFTTRDGAAGLGLSQAYAFARQSGGILSIDSEPGEGAEVSITLPLAPPAQAEQSPLPMFAGAGVE